MLILFTLIGLSASLFIRRIILGILVCIELLLLAAILSNIDNALVLNESFGQLFVAFVITLAGAETSCALALIVSYYKHLQSISL